MKTQKDFGSYGLRALVVGVLILISQPLIYLVIRASEKSGTDVIALLTRQKTLEVLGLTLALLCIVVAINVFLGTAIAAGLHYVRIPYPRLMFVSTIWLKYGIATQSRINATRIANKTNSIVSI